MLSKQTASRITTAPDAIASLIDWSSLDWRMQPGYGVGFSGLNAKSSPRMWTAPRNLEANRPAIAVLPTPQKPSILTRRVAPRRANISEAAASQHPTVTISRILKPSSRYSRSARPLAFARPNRARTMFRVSSGRSQILLLDLIPRSEVMSLGTLTRTLGRTLEEPSQPHPSERKTIEPHRLTCPVCTGDEP
jgi:hypothetical protein